MRSTLKKHLLRLTDHVRACMGVCVCVCVRVCACVCDWFYEEEITLQREKIKFFKMIHKFGISKRHIYIIILEKWRKYLIKKDFVEVEKEEEEEEEEEEWR